MPKKKKKSEIGTEVVVSRKNVVNPTGFTAMAFCSKCHKSTEIEEQDTFLRCCACGYIWTEELPSNSKEFILREVEEKFASSFLGIKRKISDAQTILRLFGADAYDNDDAIRVVNNMLEEVIEIAEEHAEEGTSQDIPPIKERGFIG